MVGYKFEPVENWIPPGYIVHYDARLQELDEAKKCEFLVSVALPCPKIKEPFWCESLKDTDSLCSVYS